MQTVNQKLPSQSVRQLEFERSFFEKVNSINEPYARYAVFKLRCIAVGRQIVALNILSITIRRQEDYGLVLLSVSLHYRLIMAFPRKIDLALWRRFH